MSITNTIWLCFICAGITCLRTLIAQRLRGRGHRQNRSVFTLPRLHCKNFVSEDTTGVPSASPGSALPLQAPLIGEGRQLRAAPSDRDCECISPPSILRQLHTAAPPRTGCDDSVSCSSSDADSTSSSPSISQADSDAESDGRRRKSSRIGSTSSSAALSDDERPGAHASAPVMTFADGSTRRLRPAIRLNPPAGGRRRKAKSVSFDTEGAIICSPPTVEALGLLASGTPPLSVAPRVCIASVAASEPSTPPAPKPSSVATAVVASRPSANDSVGDGLAAAAAQPAARTSAVLAAAEAPPVRPAASTSPLAPPARPAISAGGGSGSLHPTISLSVTASSPWSSSPSAEHAAADAAALLLFTDSAHALALARAAAGRRRVMAALEAAKSRHFHLGRSLLAAEDHDRAGEALRSSERQQRPSPHYHHQQQQQPQHGSRSPHCEAVGLDQSGERQRPVRLPHLPLAPMDVSILSVGYVPGGSPSAVAAAAAPSPADGWRSADQAAAATPSRSLDCVPTGRHECTWYQAARASACSGGGSGGSEGSSLGPAAAAAVAQSVAEVNGIAPLKLQRGSLKGLGGLLGDLRSKGGTCGGGGAAVLGGLAAADRVRLAAAVGLQQGQVLSIGRGGLFQ